MCPRGDCTPKPMGSHRRIRRWTVRRESVGGRLVRSTTTGYVALLELIAGTVWYLYMRLLVELHGQPGWVAALTPFSVEGA
jgi:hypothetical protein